MTSLTIPYKNPKISEIGDPFRAPPSDQLTSNPFLGSNDTSNPFLGSNDTSNPFLCWNDTSNPFGLNDTSNPFLGWNNTSNAFGLNDTSNPFLGWNDDQLEIEDYCYNGKACTKAIMGLEFKQCYNP